MNVHSRLSLSFFSRTALLFFFLAAFPLTRAAAQSPQSGDSAPVLQPLAARGDSRAQYRLARLLLAHDPSPADIQAGLQWLHASAAQNNLNALYYLGDLYEHGQFVSRDYNLAFQNYNVAAQAHYPAAENNLASLYQHGKGVHKDLTKAFEWYLSAAQHGDAVGQLNLASLYFLGAGTPRDLTQTVRWLRSSANSGLPESQSSLAYFYFNGITVQRDYSEAARLVRLAAEQGFPLAETDLGYLYEIGKGVPLDYVSAYSWYTRAINSGDSTGADRRKQLAHIMTRKQLDEASTLSASSSGPTPNTAPHSSSISTLSPNPLPQSPSAFSLVNH